MTQAPESAAFRFVQQVPVRFRDLDAMGHAHHSLVLVYIEEARAAYWRAVAGRASLDGIDYVLGQATVRFLKRIHFPDTLHVGVRTSRIGNSSLTMEYEIRNPQGELLATAQTVQVMYDYQEGRSKIVSTDLRSRLVAFEGEPHDAR